MCLLFRQDKDNPPQQKIPIMSINCAPAVCPAALQVRLLLALPLLLYDRSPTSTALCQLLTCARAAMRSASESTKLSRACRGKHHTVSSGPLVSQERTSQRCLCCGVSLCCIARSQ